MSLGHDGLGFAGLLAIGVDPRAAWQDIHDGCQHQGIQAMFTFLEGTEDGRAALEYARQRWAAYGLPAPWPPDATLPEVTP